MLIFQRRSSVFLVSFPCSIFYIKTAWRFYNIFPDLQSGMKKLWTQIFFLTKHVRVLKSDVKKKFYLAFRTVEIFYEYAIRNGIIFQGNNKMFHWHCSGVAVISLELILPTVWNFSQCVQLINS